MLKIEQLGHISLCERRKCVARIIGPADIAPRINILIDQCWDVARCVAKCDGDGAGMPACPRPRRDKLFRSFQRARSIAELLIHRQDCRRVLNLISCRNVGGIRNHGIRGGKWCWISCMVQGIPPGCQKFLQMRQKRGCRLFPGGGWRGNTPIPGGAGAAPDENLGHLALRLSLARP